MKKEVFTFSVRDICEISLMAALAIVLDRFVKIPIGATGGSINISTLPLFLVALRHGWFKGFIASGIVYGLTTCLLDAYGMQFFVFDYLIAFGSIAIGGLFSKLIFRNYNKSKALNIVISFALVVAVVAIFFVIRTLSASMDSMIFYGYTFGASVVYNISYIGPSCIAVAVLLCLLFPAISLINKFYPSSFLKEEYDEVEENE